MFLLYALYHIFDKKLQHLCYFLVYYLNHLLFKLALSVHLKVLESSFENHNSSQCYIGPFKVKKILCNILYYW